jgi:hypothetical protein
MVRGNWIINLEQMRCKNWVNGIEVVFYTREGGETVEGTIQYVPQEIFEKIPATVDFVLYMYRMWRSASYVFKKAYFRRKKQRSLVPDHIKPAP